MASDDFCLIDSSCRIYSSKGEISCPDVQEMTASNDMINPILGAWTIIYWHILVNPIAEAFLVRHIMAGHIGES